MLPPRGLVLALLVCHAAACAEAPPPPVVPKPAEVAAPEAKPDLSPVEEPKSLMLVARWKSPTKGLDKALSVLGVPLSLETMFAKEAPEVFGAIQLDASLDLALCLDPASSDDDPRVFAAVSLPLASFERARAAAEKEGALEDLKPGIVRLAPKGEGKARCDIAASIGDAPARLVCGASARDLEALRGWMTRGLPRTPNGSDDLTATIRFRPLQDRYLPQLRKKSSDLAVEANGFLTREGVHDQELLEAPNVVIEESLRFLEDVDRFDFRTALSTKPPELVAGGTLRFARKTSWITRELTDASGQARPAPATYWRLPKDASSASWGQSQDAHRFDGIRSVLRKAVLVALERAPITQPDKKALVAFVDAIPRTSGPWVSATGVLHAPKRPDKANRTPAELLADTTAYAKSALGWYVAGVHGPASDYVAWAKQGLDVYQRGVRLVREKATKPKDKEFLAFIPVASTSTSPPGWPKGTTVFDLKVTFDSEIGALFLPRAKRDESEAKASKAKKGPAPKASITLRLAIVPDGDDTWIGLSADPAELQKRMNAVMTGAPAAQTIASREGLEGLRGGDRTWAGFFSFGDVLESTFDTLKREAPNEVATLESLYGAMPNRGRTPILMLGSGTGGNAPSSSAEVRLQQGTLADVAGLAAFLSSDRGRELLKKL